jgi:hypothetical protein
MSTIVSRYGIIPSDLRIHALVLNVGNGMADRFNTPDAVRFIVDAERNVEEQVSDYIGVPLKPTAPRPGLTPPVLAQVPSPPTPPDFPPPDGTRSNYSPEVSVTPQGTKWNYPHEFIEAIIFKAIGLMLRSEFFEYEPTKSEISLEADARADGYIFLFRVRPTVLVGAGRRRNPNPHMPPSIAPKGSTSTGGLGGGG